MRVKKDEILRLETLITLLELGGRDVWITTAKIHDKLYVKGLLKDKDAKSLERRKLQRLLKSLSMAGYLESRGASRGRGGKVWRLKRDALAQLEYLGSEERRKLMLSYTFLPVGYKDKFVKDVKDALSRVSGGIITGNVLEECLGKFIEFEERYAEVDTNTLLKILEAIEKTVEGEEIILKFHYKNRLRLVVPVRLFSYEGLLQLSAWELSDKNAVEKEFTKAFIVALIEAPEILSLTSADRLGKIYEKDCVKIKKVVERLRRRGNFVAPDEEPFIFSVELEKIDNALIERGYKISPLQIGEINPKKSEVALVGYTSKRYAFRFLNVVQVKRIIRPTEHFFYEYVERAKEEGYAKLPKGFRENTRRFKRFIKELRSVLHQKLACLDFGD